MAARRLETLLLLGVVVALAVAFNACSRAQQATPQPTPSALSAALSAALRATLRKMPVPVPKAGLNDRDAMADLVGLPDVFEVSFEVPGGTDASADKVVRYDTWTYYDLLTAFEFADGALIASYPVDDVLTLTVVPNRLDPRTFDRTMTWAKAFERLGRPAQVARNVLPAEYEATATAYVTGQMLLVFDDEGLVYVESIALAAGAIP